MDGPCGAGRTFIICSEPLAVGDRVTVRTFDSDPIEISLHRHAVITAADCGAYMVGHPGMSERRYGRTATPNWHAVTYRITV